MKTYKAIAKRFRVTKNGKVIQKRTGLNHFRTKKTGAYKLAKRKKASFPEVYQKTILKRMKI
jgi:ribosomal protein L35